MSKMSSNVIIRIRHERLLAPQYHNCPLTSTLVACKLLTVIYELVHELCLFYLVISCTNETDLERMR